MRLILLGPPGAGKGTQAARLSARFGIPHVATGDLLRFAVAWETEIGKRAKDFMERGELVPDEIVLELLRRRLSEPDAADGFLLDGFPRNTDQADALEANLEEIGQAIDTVVSLEVPDDLIVQRLGSRWSCPTCGAAYNLVSSPPKQPGICDRNQTPLFQREDDRPEVIRKRLEVFRAQTEPLVAYYERRGLLVRANGVGQVDEVEARIAKALENRNGTA